MTAADKDRDILVQDGVVQVIISNGLSSNITISNVEISVIPKQAA